MHTLLDLRGNIPAFVHITDGKVNDVNVLGPDRARRRSVLRDGSRLHRFRAPVRADAQRVARWEAVWPDEVVRIDLRDGWHREHAGNGDLNPGGGEDGEEENAMPISTEGRIQTSKCRCLG